MRADDEIRQADAADAEAVTACVRLAYEMYLHRMEQPPGPMLQDYDQVIADHHVWVLQRGQDVAGVLVLMTRDDHVLLDNIAVRPEFHGQGLGGRLLAHADHETRRMGYGELRLYTHVTMTENVELYQAKGWSIIGQGIEDGYERIFMAKTLEPL